MNVTALKNKGEILLFGYNGEKVIMQKSLAKSKLLYILYQDFSDNYGVFIHSKIFGQVEIAKCDEVSSDIFVAKELFDLLCENIVLPNMLKEVVNEFIKGNKI